MNTNEIKFKAIEYLRKAGLSDDQIARLDHAGFFTAPSSSKHNLAKPGGLAEHSVHVTDQLLALGAFDNEASAYRVGMLHDLVECFSYAVDPESGKYISVPALYPGHGVASVLYAHDLGIRHMDAERYAIIWHAGTCATDDKRLQASYDIAKRLFPRQVVLTRAADSLAALYRDTDKPAKEG